MENVQQPLTRLAVRVQQAVSRGCLTGLPTDRVDRVVSHLVEISGLSRRRRLAEQHGWRNAAARLQPRLARQLRDLAYDLSGAERALRQPPTTIPDLRAVLADLHQLEDEFGALHLRHSPPRVGVVTRSIVLDGLYLGPFELRLGLDALATGDYDAALTAVALDPHPCVHDELVVHPHVSGNCICLGDAADVVHQALRAGRIADVFLIARSVLETYNPHSPFCALRDWHGRVCADCGEVTSEDAIQICPQCEQDCCVDCVAICTTCDSAACRDCQQCCPLCDETVCGDCLECCTGCDASACADCLDDGQCPTCLENSNDENEEATFQDSLRIEAQESATGSQMPVGAAHD